MFGLSPEELKQYGVAIVAVVTVGVTALEAPVRRLFGGHKEVKKIEQAEDFAKAGLSVAEAEKLRVSAEWKIVLDKAEARELHLVDSNETLLRQADERTREHETAINFERNRASVAVEEMHEWRRKAEASDAREEAMRRAMNAADVAHEDRHNRTRQSLASTRGLLDAYVRRYGNLGGTFTATDVLGNQRNELDPPE